MSALARPLVQRQSEPAPAFRAGTGPPVQRSALRVSSPADPAEREARSAAHAVVNMRVAEAAALRVDGAGTGVLRRQAPALDRLRTGPDVIQRSAAPAAPGGEVASRIQSSLSGGAPLPASVRRFMEPRFGASFADVRIHTDINAASLSRQVAAQAFTTGNHIFFARDQFQPATAAGRELIAHELTHTIQQGAVVRQPAAGIRRQEDLTITPQPDGVVQRLGLSDIVDGLAELAANVPGFTLLTLIIGRNPINLRAVERNAQNVLRAFMGLIPGGEILFQVLARYGVIERLGTWAIQQTAALGLSFDTIRAAFGRFTDSLGWRDIFSARDVWRRAQDVFAPMLGRITSFVAGLVAQAVAWLKDTLMEPLAAFCREIPGYGLVTVMLGRDPFTNAAVPRTALTVVRAFAEFIPGGTAKVTQLVESGALERAHAWFTQETQARNLTWARVTGTFAEAWASLRLEDVLHPIDTLRRMVTLFRPLMADLISFAGAALMKLLELIFEAVMGAGGARVLAILKRARATFLVIINDPVAFLRNLLGAVGQGVRQFMANILGHLRDGVIAWLTGPVAAAGIQMPERWDLRGIIGFVLQILGLTWARVRAKLVSLLGDRAVAMLESGFALIQQIRDRGLVQALRDRVTEFFGSLREAALGAIRSFIQTRLVQAGITQLLSLLNPVGVVIQAIIKTYTTIQFFIQRINQILDLVESVLNSIGAIASGAIGAAASFVERTMARTIPVVLDFLARFIGLGDVGAQVQTTIRNLQGSVDKMLDRAVEWIRTQATRLGSAVVQAGVPQDPNERLRLAGRAATIAARALGGRMTRGLLEPALALIRTRFGLTSIQPFERNNRWWVRAVINPEREEDLQTPSGAFATDSARVDKLIYAALVLLSRGLHFGWRRDEGATTAGPAAPPAAARGHRRAPSEAASQQQLLAQREAALAADPAVPAAQRALAELQNAYGRAASARPRPEPPDGTIIDIARAPNTFSAFGHQYFVDQITNNYVVPADRVKHALFRAGKIGPENARIGDEYNYTRRPLTLARLRFILQTLGGGGGAVGQDEGAMFVASMAAEPSRYSVAHITNLLALGAPELPGGTGFRHLSMTRGGTDPGGGRPTDPNLGPSVRAPQIVTDRDLQIVRRRADIIDVLTRAYQSGPLGQ